MQGARGGRASWLLRWLAGVESHRAAGTFSRGSRRPYASSVLWAVEGKGKHVATRTLQGCKAHLPAAVQFLEIYLNLSSRLV